MRCLLLCSALLCAVPWQALRSVAEQSYRNFELIVLDESTLFDVGEVLREFEFPDVKMRKFHATPLERSTQNRIGANLNEGLSLDTGDLVCYLCDTTTIFRVGSRLPHGSSTSGRKSK
jgi:hypothetical protein